MVQGPKAGSLGGPDSARQTQRCNWHLVYLGKGTVGVNSKWDQEAQPSTPLTNMKKVYHSTLAHCSGSFQQGGLVLTRLV